MLVSLVRALELGHQFSQRAVDQRLVHQVLAAAHAQRSVAAVAVDAQDNVVEAVARKLGLKADGETLKRRQAVGQVSAVKLRSFADAAVRNVSLFPHFKIVVTNADTFDHKAEIKPLFERESEFVWIRHSRSTQQLDSAEIKSILTLRRCCGVTKGCGTEIVCVE